MIDDAPALPSDPHSLEQALVFAWPPDQWCDLTTLVAVSGGPDSIALLRALVRLRPDESCGQLIVAHYNHRLRGEESDGDQAFVEKLSVTLELRCEVAWAPAPTSSENAARTARYAFLLETAHRVGARYVAVGHTADDQAETILFRLLRGTGLSGLTGMPPFRPLSEATTLVRPLLGVRRTSVLEYLQSLDQPFRIDATNDDIRFARNRLRHEVMPRLAEVSGTDVTERLLELGRQAEEAVSPMRFAAGKLLEQASVDAPARRGNGGQASEEVVLQVGGFGDVPRPVVREVFVELWKREGWPRGEMTFTRWDDLAEMVLGERDPPARMFPGAIRVERLGEVIRLLKTPPT